MHGAECSWYTERERAALAWTEALTLVTQGHVPDAVYEEARRHFDEKELTDLSIAITTINAWNRLCIAARTPPGSHRPKAASQRVSRLEQDVRVARGAGLAMKHTEQR